MKIAPLSPSDETAALALLSACFADEPEEYFRSYHRLLPAGRPDVQLAAKIDDRLVGYLECQWVEQYFGDRTLPVANIGAVCTDPEFRRRGIARGLLKRRSNWLMPKVIHSPGCTPPSRSCTASTASGRFRTPNSWPKFPTAPRSPPAGPSLRR